MFLKRKLFLVGGIFYVLMLNSIIAQEFMVGADLSFLKEAEDAGFEFKENNKVTSGLEIFKSHGYNWVRLRLFHNPTDLPNNLAYTIDAAQKAKEKGFKLLLNFHYSDTWADPSRQNIPKAWLGKTAKALELALQVYTEEVLTAFKAAAVYPDMVQIGNEISHGMLWPQGSLPKNWDNFAAFIKAGISGVHASAKGEALPKIMIHIANGGDAGFTKYFFDTLHAYELDYDIIGQSYYPEWHGNLSDLESCLAFMATFYDKDIIIVETSYHFKPAKFIDKIGPFPESKEGQKKFLEAVAAIVRKVPNKRGKGLFWWEPAAPNKPFSYSTFFDEKGGVLPVIEVFDSEY